jgi:uncharacterized protein (DUF4415 family)
MRDEYDFSEAKRAHEVPHLARLQAEAQGKTCLTLWLDEAVVAAFRSRAEAEGKSCQTLIDETLRAALQPEKVPVTAELLRQILREELRAA